MKGRSQQPNEQRTIDGKITLNHLPLSQILGTDELFNYLDKYDLELDPHFDGIMGRHSNRPWQKFVNPENQHLVSEEAISFVGQVGGAYGCVRSESLLVGWLEMFDASAVHYRKAGPSDLYQSAIRISTV